MPSTVPNSPRLVASCAIPSMRSRVWFDQVVKAYRREAKSIDRPLKLEWTLVVRVLRDDAPDPSGHRDFSIRAPEGPYSFSGKLITLSWAIELVVLPSGETERLDLRIGPQPVEVEIA